MTKTDPRGADGLTDSQRETVEAAFALRDSDAAIARQERELEALREVRRKQPAGEPRRGHRRPEATRQRIADGLTRYNRQRYADRLDTLHPLHRLRLERGYSRIQLARRSTVAKNAICNIELGRSVPKRHTLERLARALGCSWRDLRP